MLTAITRQVSAALANCELSYIERKPIDLEKARAQHREYEKLLERCGARVVSLAAEPDLPDSMFVEDPAMVLDEVAVMLQPGAASRRGEIGSLAKAIGKFRKLEHVELPGTVEGGDVLAIERKIYVGKSKRTNAEGIRQLAGILEPLGYEVRPVGVSGCLHLKSAVTYVGGGTLLANREWLDAEQFSGCEWIDVDPAEAHAANALVLRETVVLPASFPRTRARVEERGFRVTTIDISELQKAESGLTCSCLLFEA